MQTNSRDIILQQIEAAHKRRLQFVDTNTKNTESIYKAILPDSITCFKNELESISGQFIICENEADLYEKIKTFVQQQNIPYIYCRDTYISEQLEANKIPLSSATTDFEGMKAGITGCEFLIARTGSVVISSASQSGRQMNVFPPIHIVIAHASQLVDYPEDALNAIQLKYGEELPSIISTITGPSRTADIEKTLVLGAHGPKEFVVFLTKM